MMVRTGYTLTALAAALVLGTSIEAEAYDPNKISPPIVPNFKQPDLSAANNAYTLSAAELKYDCKRLTGHMQVRIRQLRSTMADTSTSGLSQAMKQAAKPLWGGTDRGVDPAGDNARDLSKLRAYNGQLAAKNCPTFALEALLAPGNTDPPRPTPKAAAATAAKPR